MARATRSPLAPMAKVTMMGESPGMKANPRRSPRLRPMPCERQLPAGSEEPPDRRRALWEGHGCDGPG
eukprot:7074795-Heterocapsa_arctica.AAC.1